jgi:hypothetical protein
MGLPVRPPDCAEATLLDRLALALIDFGTEEDLIAQAGLPSKRKSTTPKYHRRQGGEGEG